MPMTVLFFDDAFLPSGWQRNVKVSINEGFIVDLEIGAARGESTYVKGIALPGLPNLHCHAFQRGMAGLAERRGPNEDSFWTWREVMYRFLGRLSPDDVEAIAAQAYVEMLERGFTAVGEFHYLHNDIDGTPYGDPAEMTSRIAAAADVSKIGLTLLPSFYANGGFGGETFGAGQRRFVNSPDRFLNLVELTRAIAASLPNATVGIAPHSLRAVTPDALRAVIDASPTGPIHIHAAEQTKEVDDCLAWSGRRPVKWLMTNADVDERWCLIHATHMTTDETQRLAASGAVVGLCPITEASLGDGIFNGPEFLAARGRFGVGTDSNIEIDAPGELKLIEYSQRLARRARNVMTLDAGESTGQRLLTSALSAGAQALARPIGAIAVGHRADLLVLDSEDASLAATTSRDWLDAWIFGSGTRAIETVYVSGDKVVSEGRHIARDAVVARYRAAMRRLARD